MSLIMLVHLLLECSFAAPFLGFIAHTCKKPSFIDPSVARKSESGLKATAFTPYVCSLKIERGDSDEDCCRQNISTLGL